MTCPHCDPGAAPARGGSVGLAQRRPVVVFLGNPNVGKSTLFNRVTGARQRVVNAPGTTVELQEGRWRRVDADVVDLPGTYSLLARTPDEQVAADTVLGRPPQPMPDLVVVLLDATALARSLYLLAQVAEAGRPVLAAITLADVARDRGEPVDADALARVLGIPVVVVDPRTGHGCDALGDAVRDALTTHPHVRDVPAAAVPSGPADSLEEVVAHADALFAWVSDVMAAIGPAAPPTRRTLSDRVDAVLLHPWVGIPVFLLVMWVLFQVATAVAAPFMDAAESLVSGPVSGAVGAVLAAVGMSGGWFEGLVVDGVLAGVGTVLAFVPLLALMFLVVAILEDSGYLARAAFVADRGMRALGLDGRALLPVIVGFGCNVPALTALRTLPSSRQRLLMGLLVPFTSCTARLAVYILIATAFFPDHAGTVIFAMYVVSVALVVLGGLVGRRTLFRDLTPGPLVLVLPAYQRPRLGALLTSAWLRVWAFVRSAGKIIVITLTVVWALLAIPVSGDHAVGDVPVPESAYGALAEGIAPAFAPAGFDDWHASAALMTGFVAKEVVVGSFAQSYAVADEADTATLGAHLRATFDAASGGHAGAAALAFMVFCLAYTPCLATVAEQRRLYGWRWTGGAMAVQIGVAWLAAVAVFQVGRLL